MQTSDVILPLDLTGLKPENKKTNESHTLVNSNGRLIVPVWGAFFRDSLVIVDDATGDPLPATAYLVMDFYQHAALRTGKDVFNTIVIVDDTVSANVTLEYQALGGPFSRNREKLIEWLAERDLSTGVLPWTDVTDVPRQVIPAEHKHLLAHVYGMEYIVEGLGRIEEAMVHGSGPVYHQTLDSIEAKLAALGVTGQQVTSTVILEYVNSFKAQINKESIGLGLLENLDSMSKPKGMDISRSSFNPNEDGTREYVTIDSLDGFGEGMHEEVVTRVTTHLGSAQGYVEEPHRSTLLSMVNGAVILLRSQKDVVDSGGYFELDIYPKGVSEADSFVVTKVSNNSANYGGAFLSINQRTGETYRGTLRSDACDHRFVWKRVLFLGDLDEMEKLIQDHRVDDKNPHETDKHELGLSKLENLPVVTEDEILNKTSRRVYLTLDTLMYFMKAFMTNAKPPPLPGEEVDPNAVTMDQAMIIFGKCCEDTPPKQVWPSKGQLITAFCMGSDRFARYTDGTGGFYDEVLELNSGDCNFIKRPDAGTLLSQACGIDEYPPTSLVGTYADGAGGTYNSVIEHYSTKCGGQGPAAHPAEGTLLDTFCSGIDKKAKHADGKGGSYEVVIEVNSVECGGIPVTPAPTPIPAFTELSRACDGVNMVAKYADGSGGTYTEVVRYNSPDCGGTSPTTPTPPGPTPGPGTPPGETPAPTPAPTPPPITAYNPTITCATETFITTSEQFWIRIDLRKYPPSTRIDFNPRWKNNMENDSAYRYFPIWTGRETSLVTQPDGNVSRMYYFDIPAGLVVPGQFYDIGAYTDAFIAPDGLPVAAAIGINDRRWARPF